MRQTLFKEMAAKAAGKPLLDVCLDEVAALRAQLAAQQTRLGHLRDQRFELMGIEADVTHAGGFDATCLQTLRRVIGALGEESPEAAGESPAGGMTHIDDWLDSPRCKDMGERYAKFVLWYFRYPAWAKNAFAPWMKERRLFCTYEGKRYRCTGASRMGDVWLTADFDEESTYDHRVDVAACSAWSDAPAGWTWRGARYP